MRSSSLLSRSYTIVFVYSVYFHWVPYSLFWVIFSYHLSCYSTGKFSPFLSRNILHLFIGSLLLNLCYFFIICKKKLIHSRSWNRDIFKKNKKVKRRCNKIINHITCLYFIIHHCEFLEYWNTQKSVWRIWQHFSCLLEEGIPKIF